MRESNDITNAFISTEEPGSAERRAAIQQLKADTIRVAEQIEELLDKRAEPSRYLTRILQHYVDGMLLYSENM
jgi:hypothetical protein